MKTLHLNLKKKWFDMILSGEKTEEYREVSGYWAKRFIDFYCGRKIKQEKGQLNYMYQFVIDLNDSFSRCLTKILWRHYDTITFSNGYAKNRDQFVIELEHIKIHHGIKEWGAEEDKKYFVLSLGKIIKQ